MLKISKKKKTLLKQQNFVKDNKESFEMFKNILFFNMESYKLIIQHTCVEGAWTIWYHQSVQHPGREKGKVL
jgi:hypothetical protein